MVTLGHVPAGLEYPLPLLYLGHSDRNTQDQKQLLGQTPEKLAVSRLAEKLRTTYCGITGITGPLHPASAPYNSLFL